MEKTLQLAAYEKQTPIRVPLIDILEEMPSTVRQQKAGGAESVSVDQNRSRLINAKCKLRQPAFLRRQISLVA
jgi:hypothetical protein